MTEKFNMKEPENDILLKKCSSKFRKIHGKKPVTEFLF